MSCSGRYKKNIVLGSATAGSGNAICKARDGESYEWPNSPLEERKLSYDDTQLGKKWENCVWRSDIGAPPKGASDTYCRSACPAGMVRVAMSALNGCDFISYKSLCCDDQYVIEKVYTNPQPKLFSEALDSYLVDGLCPTGGAPSVTSRDVLVTDWDKHGSDSRLMRRDKSAFAALEYLAPYIATMLVLDIAAYTAIQAANAQAWNSWAIANGWQGLVWNNLHPFVQALNLATGTSLQKGWLLQRRDIDDLTTAEAALLLKETKTYKVWSPHDELYIKGLTYHPLGYTQARDWSAQSVVYRRARDIENRKDRGNPFIVPRIMDSDTKYHTEHILELQLLGLFFEAATKGTLRSGAKPTSTPIDAAFFVPVDRGSTGAIDSQNIVPQTQLFFGDPAVVSSRPLIRLIGAFGSKTNDRNFYLLASEVDRMKARVFGDTALVAADKWKTLVEDLNEPALPFQGIKYAIGVWHYLLDDEVKKSWVELEENLRSVFKAIDTNYFQEPTFIPAWNEWWCDYSQFQFKRSETWIADAIESMAGKWRPGSDSDPVQFMTLNTLM